MWTRQADFVKKTRSGRFHKPGGQLVLAAVMALAGSLVSLEAGAQSSVRINNSIRALERDSNFRNLAANSQQLAATRRSLGNAENSFSRSGCQRALNSGQTLSRDCRTLARQILRERREISDLEQKVNAGQAIARQREQLLARRGEAGNSTVTITRRQPSFLEQLFGSFGPNSQTIIEGEYQFGNFGTVRSVCVRKADGYYWPVSFSTLPEYLADDAALCNRQCPGKEVELYYYSNPGQDPADMVNLQGEPYTALPNAFSYRTEYDLANSCNVRIQGGTIELVEVAGGLRTYLNSGDINLPLPLRDPRQKSQNLVATAINIPLPRPRPGAMADSEFTPPLDAKLRVVELNGRVVRIVGPDTPYGQSAATGS